MVQVLNFGDILVSEDDHEVDELMEELDRISIKKAQATCATGNSACASGCGDCSNAMRVKGLSAVIKELLAELRFLDESSPLLDLQRRMEIANNAMDRKSPGLK